MSTHKQKLERHDSKTKGVVIRRSSNMIKAFSLKLWRRVFWNTHWAQESTI
jgi:hypothetical protein